MGQQERHRAIRNAEQKGERARYCGQPIESNPYTPRPRQKQLSDNQRLGRGTGTTEAWLRGWQQADTDMSCHN